MEPDQAIHSLMPIDFSIGFLTSFVPDQDWEKSISLLNVITLDAAQWTKEVSYLIFELMMNFFDIRCFWVSFFRLNGLKIQKREG